MDQRDIGRAGASRRRRAIGLALVIASAVVLALAWSTWGRASGNVSTPPSAQDAVVASSPPPDPERTTTTSAGDDDASPPPAEPRLPASAANFAQLRGTVVLVDAGGRRHGRLDGTLDLVLLSREVRSGGRFVAESEEFLAVTVHEGAWTAALEKDYVSFAADRALLGGRPVIERDRSWIDLPSRPLLQDFRAELVVDAAPMASVRVVDGESGAALRDVVGAPADLGRSHLEEMPSLEHMVVLGDSPVELFASSRQAYPERWTFRAPGFAWEQARLDFNAREVVTVRLRRSGGLSLVLRGPPPDERATVRVYRQVPAAEAPHGPDGVEDEEFFGRVRTALATGAHVDLPIVREVRATEAHGRETVVHGLVPGIYHVRLEVGRHLNPGRCSAPSTVEVFAGALASATVEVPEARAEPPRRSVRGTLAAGAGWEGEHVSLQFRLVATATGWSEPRLPVAASVFPGRVPPGGAVLPWEAELVEGEYVVEMRPTASLHALHVERGAHRGLDLVAPDAGRLEVAVGLSGTAAAEELSVSWQPDPVQPLGGSGAHVPRPYVTARVDGGVRPAAVTLLVPSGPGTLRVVPIPAGAYARLERRLVVGGGAPPATAAATTKVDVVLEQVCLLDVEVVERAAAARSVFVDASQIEVRVERRDEAGSFEKVASWGRRWPDTGALGLWVPTPGPYRLRLGGPEFEPVEAVVELERGPNRCGVEVVRRRE